MKDDAIVSMKDREPVLVGTCGFVCDECPAYSKNITCEEDRQEVSRKWLELFNYKIDAARIRCDGCYAVRASGREMLHADCLYKGCAEEKKVEKCSKCSDYMCPKLDEYIGAYETLSKSPQISKKDLDKYFKAHINARKATE